MKVELFSRPGCHLCEVALELLRKAAARHPMELIVRNVEERADWEECYGREIPVVLIEGRKAFKYRIQPDRLERYLSRRVKE